MSDIDGIRNRIISQADAMGDDGWMMIAVPDSVRADCRLRVPRGAFEMWAVARSHGAHLTVGWIPVSRTGMKQGADDPFHTDWMLGAGLGLQDMREAGGSSNWSELSAAAYSARGEVEKRLLGFSCSILLAGPTVRGRVHVPSSSKTLPDLRDEEGLPPILIVKNAGPTWLEAATAALDAGGAVVVEIGGEMAHLITVLRATNKGPIVRMERARELYPHGSVLEVAPSEGRLTLMEDERVYRQMAAEAVRAAGAPRVRTTTRKPRTDGVALHPLSTGVRTSPTDRYPNLYPGYSERVRGYRIVGALHSNDGGVNWSTQGMLAISIREEQEGRDTTIARYVTDYRQWETGEISRVCRQAFETALPDVVAAWRSEAEDRRQAERNETQRLEDERQAALDGMSEEELAAHALEQGNEEFGLVDDYEKGHLDDMDLRELSKDYADLFHRIEATARSRGFHIDTDALRPIMQLPVPNAYRPYAFESQNDMNAVTP